MLDNVCKHSSWTTKRTYCIYIVLVVHVGSFEFDNDLQNFAHPQSLVAGLEHNQSGIILCSGSFYNSFYVVTSCRCLFSFIAIHPFYKERDPAQYRVSVVESGNERHLEVSHFVIHPLCMKVKVKKPYKNHFGLIVLKKEFLVSQMVAPLSSFSDIEFARTQIIRLSQDSAKCVVLGHHTDSGEVQIGTTKMIMMSADECLFRLCIPKIGCKGERNRIANEEDFCLKVPGDVRLEARFLEGSSVQCGGHVIGIVISPGNSRYPKVPTIFAAVTQYLRIFPPRQP